jgi:hypothetical protein
MALTYEAVTSEILETLTHKGGAIELKHNAPKVTLLGAGEQPDFATPYISLTRLGWGVWRQRVLVPFIRVCAPTSTPSPRSSPWSDARGVSHQKQKEPRGAGGSRSSFCWVLVFPWYVTRAVPLAWLFVAVPQVALVVLSGLRMMREIPGGRAVLSIDRPASALRSALRNNSWSNRHTRKAGSRSLAAHSNGPSTRGCVA